MSASELPAIGTDRSCEQRARDRDFLVWIARFRFVSAEVVSLRFGVSDRKCRKRLARLEQSRLVVSHQPHRTSRKLYAIGSRGRALLGLERRRPPRWETQQRHELAIGELVARLETQRPGLRVLTERDCRRAESAGLQTYSVACQQQQGLMRRWPDIITEGDGQRAAVEIELAHKSTSRLRAIMLGYLLSRQYDLVHILCGDRVLHERVRRLAGELAAGSRMTVGLWTTEDRELASARAR